MEFKFRVVRTCDGKPFVESSCGRPIGLTSYNTLYAPGNDACLLYVVSGRLMACHCTVQSLDEEELLPVVFLDFFPEFGRLECLSRGGFSSSDVIGGTANRPARLGIFCTLESEI